MQSIDYDKVFCEFAPIIYRAALCKTGDADTAQDILQEVLLLLCKKQPNFKCKSQLRVWLVKCAYKLAAATTRRFENTKTVPIDAAESIGVQDNLEFEFYDVLARLPENLRDATILFYIEDMTLNDIAKVLSISVSAVKLRLLRARKVLEKIYKEEIL